MSVIAGVIGGGQSGGGRAVERMLERMELEPGWHRRIWRGENAVLGVSAPMWQVDEIGGEQGLLAVTDQIVVVADATLYYREELKKDLRRASLAPTGDTPAELILAAYQAWGYGCVDRVEGDWAFAVWDIRARELFCARDMHGRRVLLHAEVGGGLVIGTTNGGIRAHGGCSDELNLVAIANTAAALVGASHETCYRAIQRLLPGHTLRWRQAGPPQTARFWNPEPRELHDGPSFREAAEHLRHLLTRAAEERFSRTGATSIQLSGGWDSSSLFAVGNSRMKERGDGEGLKAVSISYPPGDPGREDEIIEEILAFWGAQTRWIDAGSIPPPQVEAPERERDDPFTSPYENWNRSLAEAGGALGTHVMFDGFGGDSLFQCSPIYFADLLRKGRLRLLRRDWKERQMKGARTFFDQAVRPLLPGSVLDLLETLSGRRMSRPRERPIPSWMDAGFLKRHQIIERERALTPRYSGPTYADEELHWQLTNPWMGRMLHLNYALGIESGLEIRSPLYDRRVIEFAIGRPRTERASRHETKQLLRESVTGLLPESVLRPRRYRTGMTYGYLARAIEESVPRVRRCLTEKPILAELGIIEPGRLLKALDRMSRDPLDAENVLLYFTMNTELWLRGRLSDGRNGSLATLQ